MIEEAVSGDASITTALAGMLEVLPQGASKAAGIEVVLETLGIKRNEIMALGDAENDLQMLEMAGVRFWAGWLGARGCFVQALCDSGTMHAGVCGNGKCCRGGQTNCELHCADQ